MLKSLFSLINEKCRFRSVTLPWFSRSLLCRLLRRIHRFLYFDAHRRCRHLYTCKEDTHVQFTAQQSCYVSVFFVDAERKYQIVVTLQDAVNGDDELLAHYTADRRSSRYFPPDIFFTKQIHLTKIRSTLSSS